MHHSARFFANPEMICLTAALLGNDGDLFSLLVCSRQTYRSTVPVLWQKLPSPQPLFRLFSSYQFRASDSAFTFLGLVYISELERFKYYAFHVQSISSLYLTKSDQQWIDPVCFQILHIHLQAPLFPSLLKVGIFVPFNKHLLPLTSHAWPASRLTTVSLVIDNQSAINGFEVLSSCAATLVKLGITGRDCLHAAIAKGVQILARLQVFLIDMSAPCELGGPNQHLWANMCAKLPHTIHTIFLCHPPISSPIISPLRDLRIKNLVIRATYEALTINAPDIWSHIRGDVIISFYLSVPFQKARIVRALNITHRDYHCVKIYPPAPTAVLRTRAGPVPPVPLEVKCEFGGLVRFHDTLVALSSQSHHGEVHRISL